MAGQNLVRAQGTEIQQLFRLLKVVETTLERPKETSDPKRVVWLCESVATLTSAPEFERQPSFSARAWIAAANVHKLQGNSRDELSCLRYALTIKPDAPLQPRIEALTAARAKASTGLT